MKCGSWITWVSVQWLEGSGSCSDLAVDVFPSTRGSSSRLVFHSVKESVIMSQPITRRISKRSSTDCFLISPKFGLL